MKNIFFIFIYLFFSNVSFCQNENKETPLNEDIVIIKAIEINNNLSNIQRFKKLTKNSKYLKIKYAHVKYANKNEAPFDFNYLDSLVIDKNFNYYIYNDDTNGRIKLVCVYQPDSQELVSYVNNGEEEELNDIFNFFKNEEICVMKIAFAPGFSVIYKGEIWMVDGYKKTDLNTFLKERYTLEGYRRYFLREK